MKHKFTIELETTTQIRGKTIKQAVVLLDAKVMAGQTGGVVVASQILDTLESQVRDALIKLGWTPPKS